MGGTESRTICIDNPAPRQNVIIISPKVGERIDAHTAECGDSTAIVPEPTDYCHQKVQEAERLYHKSNELMESQFNSTLTQVNQMLAGHWKGEWSEEFIQTKQQLIDCYKMYPSEPLKCKDYVHKFQNTFKTCFQNTV